MKTLAGIVDYQMGNLRSVQKAVERIGHNAIVSSNPADFEHVTHLILPGVGAFGDAMKELKKRQLVEFLQNWANVGKPFLGICLGMQLLFETSEEHGSHQGLGIFQGRVLKFHPTQIAPETKIPHMGWNQVRSLFPADAMLSGVSESPFFYFVHSYYVAPTDPAITWLTADYGSPFCAAVRSGNIFATQFHPEKSQRDGLQLLANYLAI
jgi:imidazole glycerol-phosphate synthase subunit HisH